MRIKIKRRNMSRRSHMLSQHGFTLIEIISVLVIMGVIGSVSVKKMDLISDTATNRALLEGVKELNIRESLTWADIKLSSAGWVDDGQIFSAMDTNLGSAYIWTAGPNTSGGTLSFRSGSIELSRSASTIGSMGKWK